MPHYVYILYSPSIDSFYKGRTSNLQKRMPYHNGGNSKHTLRGIPWILVWRSQKPSSTEAILLERKLKNLTRSRLIQFIEKYSEGIPDDSSRKLLDAILK